MSRIEIEYTRTELANHLKMLWEPLADEQRELLLDNVRVTQLSRGEILFSDGDTPSFLYYLVQGKIAMHHEGIAGQKQIVRMVEPGAIFGFPAAIEGRSYHSTAVAGDDTIILQIPISLMFHFIWENRDVAMLFLKEMSLLLGASVERTISLTQKHIRGRLAETLLLLYEKYGVEDDGKTLAVYLSRDDMAQMSNMTTSNAIRTLSAFAEEGLIAIQGRKLLFLNIPELQIISDRG